MDYNFREIEKKQQNRWEKENIYKTPNRSDKPKYYVLDMFPYPSGAGLHVGHPLGYIATDIIARYKRLKGYNVLHPMGYDAFGLPAEQYAIQTGRHPSVTTAINTARYDLQLKSMGFSFDWSRKINTCDSSYYKWTQWIFMQLFNSWYNNKSDKAEPINTLVEKFRGSGTDGVQAASNDEVKSFSSQEWNVMSDKEKSEELLKYRLAYLSDTMVNWCPALGTVLANDEVKDGLSERGGHPVEQRKMRQWNMRISAYAERLLSGLDTIDWSESVKEMQRNWIGKSRGASLRFKIENHDKFVEVFTTRIDTVFGVSFLVLAPEHELCGFITTEEREKEVNDYIKAVSLKSERDRISDVRNVSGAFTGAWALNPFNGAKVPIWISDYVLAGYGTGAIMAVPSGDERDYRFAKYFDLPIIRILDSQNLENTADPTKEGCYINSDFINGMHYKEAVDALIKKAEKKGIGKAKINYRMRDAIFARQRYWGEPMPVYFKDGEPFLIDDKDLPLILPEIDKYLPTEAGDPPLARAKDWKYKNLYNYEHSTMPGWAGAAWYWYRYMDPLNNDAFASPEAIGYWKDVDLYLGGAEHAAGHLLYSRFWNKFLKDIGHGVEEEPFKKLVNQGMIQGRSSFVYRVTGKNIFVSRGLKDTYKTQKLHVDVNIVSADLLNTEKFKEQYPEYKNFEFVLENGKYVCGWEVEKMSKSKFNVLNPDDIIEQYGADTLRLYEMFLGPLEQSKPWNTNGISGVFNFLRKFWNLFFDDKNVFTVSDFPPDKKELKILHKIIGKVQDDMERLSFNTSVSAFMICVNELSALKCNKRAVLEPLSVCLSPYAPHITEEIWGMLGHKDSINHARYPDFKPEFLKEDKFEYPLSVNGKVRFKMKLPLDLSAREVEEQALRHEELIKYLSGKSPKRVIVILGRMINVVV